MEIKQFTREEAIEFAKSGKWKTMSDNALFHFQLYQELLCCDMDAFHKAAEAVLGRPVFCHEFAHPDRLKEEYEGKREKPDLNEIINLIPKEKVIALIVKSPHKNEMHIIWGDDE